MVWTMNSSEDDAMPVLDGGWRPSGSPRWLHDAWCRLLLREPCP